MSLKPDDIRRVASMLTTAAEMEERAHAPAISALAAVAESAVPNRSEPYVPWMDFPDRLFFEVIDVGKRCGMHFARLERGAFGWTVVWCRLDRPYGDLVLTEPEIASTAQERPELVLRAELARLNSLRPGEIA